MTPHKKDNNFLVFDYRTALIQLGVYLLEQEYQFITVTPATHVRMNKKAEKTWATTLREIFGWNRPFKQEQLPHDIFNVMKEAGLLANENERYISAVRCSTFYGGLVFHSSFPTHEKEAVFFGPDTYRFIRAIQHFLQDHSIAVKRAIDIGSGTGAGALVIAGLRPDAKIIATDINPKALLYTHINCAIAQCASIETVESNLFSNVQGDFDLVIANPPYLIDGQERYYRHGGAKGYELSLSIVKESLKRLNPGGHLLLYTGVAIHQGIDPFYEEIKQLFKNETGWEWEYEEYDPDIFGEELDQTAYQEADRIAAIVLTVSHLI